MNAYRALLRAYPRDFREEYGEDMALLFEQQRRDEPAARVWARALLDLALTVPAQQLEARMSRTPNNTVAFGYSIGGAAFAVAAAIGASDLRIFAAGLLMAAVLLGLAVVGLVRSRAIAPERSEPVWWQVLLAGVVVIVTFGVVTEMTGELPSALWLPGMFTLLAGVAAVALGVILGIAKLAR